MRLFAISDPHLSFANPKPMDVFGPRWQRHAERLRAHWLATVGEDDAVLIAGDISWAMKLEEALPDLEWLAALPGRKVLVKGNHDYWWQGIGKVRAVAPAGLHFIQNDAVTLGPVTIGGTRLWDFPAIDWAELHAADGAEETERRAGKRGGPDPEKIRQRELERLRTSLSRLDPDAAVRVAMVHYPPVSATPQPNRITALLQEFCVDLCVFGHLHGLDRAAVAADRCRIGDTTYHLTACDFLSFQPRPIWQS